MAWSCVLGLVGFRVVALLKSAAGLCLHAPRPPGDAQTNALGGRVHEESLAPDLC